MEDTKENLTYEQAINHLEKIVRQLEQGETTLEEGLRLFSDGIKYVEICQQKLDWVEKEIKVLTEKKGNISLEPLNLIKEEF